MSCCNHFNASKPGLHQSIKWGERYVSSALNKKFAGIIAPGVYHGYRLKPGGIMKVLVEHEPGEHRSVAVVERGGYSMTIIMEDPVYVTIPASGEWFIAIEAFYIETQQGYQRIVARQQIEEHHVVLGKVTVSTDGSVQIPIPEGAISEEGRSTATTVGMTDRERMSLLLIIEACIFNSKTSIELASRLASVEMALATGGSSVPISVPSAILPSGAVVGAVVVGADPQDMGNAAMMFVKEE